MDDQALIRTYGNINLPEGTPDRPLVTFALFAYNQERYIREAVEGAFAQTYSPLEIILSDDYSSDRTFAIMNQMAEGYQGSARLIVRKSGQNRGLWMHINDAVEASTGKYIVVAAGDDISLPSRTDFLVRMMIDESALVSESNCNHMTEAGAIIAANVVSDYSRHYIWTLIDADPDYFAGGACACYRRDYILQALDAVSGAKNLESINYEDIVFATMSVALEMKPAVYNLSGLVNYRINSDSLSNFRVSRTSVNSELKLIERENFRSMNRLACVQAIGEISKKFPNLKPKLIIPAMESAIRLSEVEIAASEKSFLRRFMFLCHVKSYSELRVCIARLFGLKALAVARYVRNNMKPGI